MAEVSPNPAAERETQDMSFAPFKEVTVDARGRFYLPESVCRGLFDGVPENQRKVQIFLGAGSAAGYLLLVPVAPE